MKNWIVPLNIVKWNSSAIAFTLFGTYCTTD